MKTGNQRSGGGLGKEKIMDIRKTHVFPTQKTYYRDPIHLVRAKGSRVWDSEGREYLDVIGGIVCISVGHNHPRITARMRQMLENDDIQHITHLYLSGYMAGLAEKLAALAPGDVNKCYFTNSGSEANELAVLSARVSTGGQVVVALRHGYHGGTGVPISLCGQSSWKFPAQPPAAVVHALEPYCYRCPFGKNVESCNLECAEDIKNLIETGTPGQIAAFIMEPILGIGGFIDPPVEYHKRAYDIVKSFGGKFIADEVQTGVGRTGKHFFAIQDSGVVPDIITMAKGLGNGAPVGAVIAKSDVADSLEGKLHFNTFAGDPYQTMQASETIAIIQDEDLVENAGRRGDYLKEGMKELQKDFPILGDVRGRGLMLGLELVKDPFTKEPAPNETAELMELAKEQNLLIGKGGLWGNVIRIAPSLDISKQECDELLTKLRRSLEALGA
jgi:4-aminobutyrate aminotransferase-like enzyme